MAWIVRAIDRWDQARLRQGKPVRVVWRNGQRGYMSDLERLSLSGEHPSTAGRD
jgi:hypothetical protein